MSSEEQIQLLNLLDWERQTVLYPGVTRYSDRGAVRDVSNDGMSGEVVYSSCSEDEVNQLIAHQICIARCERYELEWKLYGHDQPDCLSERLAAAGFRAGEKEAFMVFSAGDQSLGRLGVCSGDIRQVKNKEALGDVQRIVEEVRGESCASEIEQYGFMLENYPAYMSMYVAYIEGEPAAYGRIYFHQDSKFAGLYGGQTRERYRKRGLYTQLVAVRIREAVNRGVSYVCVDALPTSEPILSKRGFQMVTYTQPFYLVE